MNIDEIRLLTPWPDKKPDVAPNSYGWCDDPQVDVFKHYLKNCKHYLEIGSFLGKSVKLALDCMPKDGIAVCIDPWWADVYESQFDPGTPIPEVMPSQWDTFCVNMWDYRDRVIPVRGLSQMRLFDLYNLNYKPDAIYIDSWHTFEQCTTDLELCHRFFPDAQIFGDDWSFKLNNSNVEGAVTYWCVHRGFRVQVHKNRVFRIIK